VSTGADRRPLWLRWAQQMQAIAQAGLAYSQNVYDRERYQQIRTLAIEIVGSFSDAPEAELHWALSAGRGYPTPKVDVRAVVIRGGEVLLVRESRTGGWTFPGGWADVGDTPAGAAERETLEESGYRVRATKLLALLDKSRHEHPPSLDYTYKVLIGCELLGGAPATSHETDAVGFFARSELPPLDLDRTTPGQIEIAYAHAADPSRPTDFD
jgi:ADP-ribose pyrophosphatase YjhB (NUDIX family)